MKPKVLVVDDEPEFLQLLEYDFIRRGFEVFTAASAIEALNQARRLLPDVILLDQVLPGLDGVSVCSILRCQPSTENIPVVMISGQDGIAGYAKAYGSGVVRYFKKPISLADVAACVCRILNEGPGSLASTRM